MDKNIIRENDPIKILGNPLLCVRGRSTEQDGCLAVDWTNSGFEFDFVGTGFLISFGECSFSEPTYIKIIIDGFRQRFAVSNGKEKVIIEGLPEKRHSVKVLKVSESDEKLLFDELILFGENVSLETQCKKNGRKMEFLGDSITCGYGVLGRKSEPSFQTFREDGTYTYAYLTAEKFDADARFISNSGKGIVCDCEGNRNAVKAIDYYEYQTRLGGICNDGWTPDVFVINIGTNDGFALAPKEDFKKASEELVFKIRKRYNNAHIIWVYGVMNSDYADILRETLEKIGEEDKKVHFLLVDSIVSHEEEIGANGHPNVIGNMRVSDALCEKISAVTGWSVLK